MAPHADRALLRWLAGNQHDSGAFSAWSEPVGGGSAIETPSPFFTSFVSQALARVPGAGGIRAAAMQYLLSQRGEWWTYNYWERESNESRQYPYPDDLDDTACALAAIQVADPSAVPPAGHAAVTSVLTRCEQAPGGPYRTWLVGDDAAAAWRDVDPVVNANIAYWLQLLGIRLPPLDAYLGATVTSGLVGSPYYQGVVPGLWCLSRGANPEDGQLSSRLRKRLHAAVRAGDVSFADRVLAADALQRLGDRSAFLAETRREATAAVRRQEWLPAPFCTDPARNGTQYWAGSACFVAATCHAFLASAASRPQIGPATHRPDRFVAEVRASVAGLLRTQSPPLQRSVAQMLAAVFDGAERSRIAAVPAAWNRAFAVPIRQPDGARLRELGAANVLGWLSYTYFDDVLDAEADPAGLPAALMAYRAFLRAADRLAGNNASLRGTVAGLLRTMDEANACEVTAARPPSLQAVLAGDWPVPTFPIRQLADRSCGQAIVPLVLLADAGVDLSSPDAQAVRSFVYHDSVVRQLSDDLHDWLDDLRRGQLTYVAAETIRSYRSLNPTQPATLDQLNRHFWDQMVGPFCDELLAHSATARSIAAQPVFKKTDELLAPLDRFEAMAKNTKQKQRDTQEFLSALREPLPR